MPTKKHLLSLFAATVAGIVGVSAVSLYDDRPFHLHPEDIDISTAALELADDLSPLEKDIATYNHQIDVLARRVERLCNGSTDPETRIRSINTILFLHERFDYKHDPSDESGITFSLANLLDTKAGSCLPLSTLYLSIAQRLNYPIYPVMTPTHSFVRYIRPDFSTTNIEPTCEGAYETDEGYIRNLSIPQVSIKSGVYMQTLSREVFLSYLIEVNAWVHWRRRDKIKVLHLLEKAINLHDRNVALRVSLFYVYQILGKEFKGEKGSYYRQRAKNTLDVLEMLGDPAAIKSAKEKIS